MASALTSLSPTEYGCLLEGVLEQAAGYAISILRNRADAEDAVQQAAMRGLERLVSYDPRRSFRGWWFTVLRHCCIDLLRSRQAHVGLDRAELGVSASGTALAWQDLADALGRLDLQQAEILRLRYFGGLTYEELSQTLAIPKGTVMSRLHYARKALASEMKGSET
ncbi:MAG: RNA polymerase sigma factor [Alphaproteobacteria bacterium]|nr:RNA polymerase sigma factor [Alphaproteobacteria bacterium]